MPSGYVNIGLSDHITGFETFVGAKKNRKSKQEGSVVVLYKFERGSQDS